MLAKTIGTQAVLANSGCRYNLSAAFAHDQVLWDFISCLSDLGVNAKDFIASVHGAPGCFWDVRSPSSLADKKQIDFTFNKYAEMKIPLLLVFSRRLMKTSDFSDKVGNYCLAKISEREGCGVIITNEDFSKYIRDKYPNLMQICSIRKSYMYLGKRSIEWYQTLASQYDRVVIHSDDNFKPDLLKQLEPKDKFEILVNENCRFLCRYKRPCDRWHEVKSKTLIRPNFICARRLLFYLHLGDVNSARLRSCELITSEISNLYNLGFKQFKIAGRDAKSHDFLYHLCRYILSADYASLVFKTLAKKLK